MKDLLECRREIDEIDEQMIKLFEKRMAVAKDVVSYKKAHDMEIFQSAREKEVIKKNLARLNHKELEKYAEIFVSNMMNISKSYQATFVDVPSYEYPITKLNENAVVGFQGVPGSFSEAALNQFFGEKTKRKNYEHFEDVFKALKEGDIDYGVVPLENSSTGAINDNYDLIRDYGFYVVGEQSISVAQHLLGVKGSSIDSLTDVYSHPQGILQSSQFLSQHKHIISHEHLNTATAAKYAADQNDIHIGAIASSQAAELYHLEILKENIQNVKSNATRFIIFSKDLEKVDGATCVSVVFTLAHKVGTLYQIMKIINDHQINMLRIESRPIKDQPWEYYFYVDFEGSLNDQNIVLALEDMKVHTNTIRILGNYIKK